MVGTTEHLRSNMREGRCCATLFRTGRNSLILSGEMSEWSIEHAWKLTPAARADAHEIPPTHSRSTTSRNNDLLQRVPVSDGVAPGFRGACDTVLTQTPIALIEIPTNVYRYAVQCDVIERVQRSPKRKSARGAAVS